MCGMRVERGLDEERSGLVSNESCSLYDLRSPKSPSLDVYSARGSLLVVPSLYDAASVER